jgi:drug/metabolite transporter (DMT)-like permease
MITEIHNSGNVDRGNWANRLGVLLLVGSALAFGCFLAVSTGDRTFDREGALILRWGITVAAPIGAALMLVPSHLVSRRRRPGIGRNNPRTSTRLQRR